MSGASRAPSSPASASLPALVWALAALSLALHLTPRPGYGFHRDELLYLAMGDHLDLFRMQFPPVIAVLAELARLLPLDLLVAIHLLSALAVLSTPFLLRAGSMLQPVIFEFLWWTGGALALVSLLAGADRRWWLGLGLAALLASPALAGQAAWGWPFFSQLQILRESQLERVTPTAFLTGQLLIAFAAARRLASFS